MEPDIKECNHGQYPEVRLKIKFPLRTGFEPVRVEPIGFQVQLLNRSDTAADATNVPRNALFNAFTRSTCFRDKKKPVGARPNCVTWYNT